MKRFLVALMAFASLGIAQTQTFSYSYGGLSIPIYPDDWDVISIARIYVPRSIVITKVTASVQIQHSGVGDLNVYLYSANGTRTRLLERNCGSTVNVDATFDDSATARFSDACPTAGGGSYRGNEPMSNANDQNAFGYWRLAVENNGSDRQGLLTGFTINITGTSNALPVIGGNTIVSTSSFLGDAVAPGESLTILGVNLGPATPVRADRNQPLPTSLGGTSVTFGGVAAPLAYVSSNVVVVQAPMGLVPPGTTQIAVASSAGTTTAASLPVVAAKPGIYTNEVGGGGQAKAVNQDGTVNGPVVVGSSARPAPVGSVVAVYATGLGTVAPAIAAGTPPSGSTLSTTVLPVTASIGGRTATVAWAGAAPGQTGTYQVNIMIPEGTAAGAARLVIWAGGAASQAGVTVEVR